MSKWTYAELLKGVRGDTGIITGDALEELRRLPDESVHMCVTSPPYWGLRDYGTRRWFGGDPTCDHDRDVEHGPHHPGQVPQLYMSRKVAVPTEDGDLSVIETNRTEAVAEGSNATTHSCSKCGAWWGQMGLEPIPACGLYVEGDEWELREDLSDEERSFVIQELIRRGVLK
jgi:hypothetical protein